MGLDGMTDGSSYWFPRLTFYEDDNGQQATGYDWPVVLRQVPLDKPYEIWVAEPSDCTANDTHASTILDDILDRYQDAWRALADM